MKIFNWVHRKFNHGSVKDGVAKDATRAELDKTEADKQALGLVDVLEGWRDGILTIGTLGLDPILELSTNQKGYFILGSEACQDKQDHEVQELELSAECQNSDRDINGVDDHLIVLSDPTSDDDEGEANPLICASSSAKKPALVLEELEVQTKPNCVAEIREEKKGRGGRVTLAELFRAENDTGMKKKKKKKEHVDRPEGKKPAAVRSKNAKKLIPHNQEKAQPIKNLNKFMRKMLKKKIYPELEGKYSKMSSDIQNKPHREMESSTGGDSMFLLS